MTHPTANNRAQFIALADALIGKGLESIWSGHTLTQWRAILADDATEYLTQGFAVAAIQGIAAAFCRETIGESSYSFAISFELVRQCEPVAA